MTLSAEPGAGAVQNLWCASISSTETVDEQDVLQFLLSAVAIRRELASVESVHPVTFYAWHDEMAGQLRFSTACCTRNTLPFAAKVQVVNDPLELVTAFLRSRYRDGIPWADLETSTGAEPTDALPSDRCDLQVWAVELQ